MSPDTDPQLSWTDENAPRSGRFGDVYFSAEDGLAETRAVFLDGCGLPGAWTGRSHFTVAELGFGTGLNIAALLDLWRREAPVGARLQVFSVEGFPMGAADAARALGRWPELAEVVAPLLALWPGRTPGFHRLELPRLGASIDLAVMDVRQALRQWQGAADAWFLDGFAPAANPGMWSDEVLELVAARSAPGARVGTFTVAGSVRRGLQAAGFQVEKRPGFGRKRERLEAIAPGERRDRPTPRIAVLGAGVAGASLARAFRAQGVQVDLVETEEPGAGASGNPAALITPRLDAGGGATAAFFAQAFERAVQLYDEVPGAVIASGVAQLESGLRDPARFDRIAAQPFWPDGAVERLGGPAATSRLGEDTPRGGLWLRDGRVIEPRIALTAWIAGGARRAATIDRIEANGVGWRLLDSAGALVLETDHVVIAAGWALARLAPGLRLTPARGQASIAAGVEATPAAWGGYIVPTRDGVLFGATFDRGDTSIESRPADDGRNLETLAQVRPALAEVLRSRSLASRARIRATTPDHLPLCGQLEPGLWVLGGLGSRGFTTAPLLAEHLAAELLGRPSPLPAELAALVTPTRASVTSAAAADDLSSRGRV